MAITKQPINVNFSQGLDLKTDEFQVQVGKFLSLKNSVFDKAGQLTKRNGYGLLTALPDTTTKYLTTFNGNLTAIGSNVETYSAGTMKWSNKGSIKPVSLSTLPAIRGSTYQGQADSVTADNGLTCVAYTDYIPSGGTVTAVQKYIVVDSITGQSIIDPTLLLNADSVYGTPRVFLLGTYFIILYTTHPAAYHIQYIAISTADPTVVTAPLDITSAYTPASTIAFDALSVNNSLYVAYNTTSGGQSIKVSYITTTLGVPVAPVTYSSEIATMFTLSADSANPASPIIYVGYYDLVSKVTKVLAVNAALSPVLAPTTINTTKTLLNLTSSALSGVFTIFYEVSNFYTFDPTNPTHYIESNTVTQAGVVGTALVVKRSVGLASKAFWYNGTTYFLAVYSSTYQPTYFLLNSLGEIISKLAYSNSGPYSALGLPNVSVSGSIAKIPYLFKGLIQAVNKAQGVANAAGVYSQLGVNIASFDFAPATVVSTEIGQNLNLSGGYVTAYDGVRPVEQGFFLYPDSVSVVPMITGGSMTDQIYYYQVTYEWADNQGNLFRSASSLPVSGNLTGGSGSGSMTIDIPTLRLTRKINNPVKIVVYRWSTAQQVYYQTTPLTAPLLNDTTVDSVQFIDTNSDAAIAGNNIIYTTGGVIENISPPAADVMTLFNNRLWLVDAEDRNLLWYSKQVIEATPVEMSDLLTMYIAPSTASEGSTGPMTALGPMDDKLVVFKTNALGYISGVGPDNTGANNQYSDFVLINSVVGCTNQQSIVFTPQGLMFQSNKGIWILGRDLSTQYIGAPVETLTTGALVQSAVNVPGTNQVRFTLDTGITLMYDYYFGQWGTFVNVPAISSTIYKDFHTYVNSRGQVLQETPGVYLDNTSPVLMSLTTGWMNLAGVQGFERFYEMYLLGKYLSPFKLDVQLGYDYNSSASQAVTVTPSSPSTAWGRDALWGSGELWGGPSNVFEARVFPKLQKCESFQVTINEIYDSSIGIGAGAGLTLSGFNLVVGMKKGYRTSKASRSFG